MKQYVFFGQERERIREPSFLQTAAFAGAQLKYTWRELEPQPGSYDFAGIRRDLAFLTAHRKRLFLQLQDVTFAPEYNSVPKYLMSDPAYHGGAAPQYAIVKDDEAHATPAGWVARRWDTAVRARFHRLLTALGREFDGKIEGINLPETAVDFGESGRLFPTGFTPTLYRDAILLTMAALKHAFPKSVTLQYANFMPGEWLPWTDHGFLKSVYKRAAEIGVGVGGPDMKPSVPGQMHHSYPLIRAAHGLVPTGIAVQDGNYRYTNPKTGKPVTLPDLLKFADEYLRVTYIFWCTEEPYYSRTVITFLKRR